MSEAFLQCDLPLRLPETLHEHSILTGKEREERVRSASKVGALDMLQIVRPLNGKVTGNNEIGRFGSLYCYASDPSMTTSDPDISRYPLNLHTWHTLRSSTAHSLRSSPYLRCKSGDFHDLEMQSS